MIQGEIRSSRRFSTHLLVVLEEEFYIRASGYVWERERERRIGLNAQVKVGLTSPQARHYSFKIHTEKNTRI